MYQPVERYRAIMALLSCYCKPDVEYYKELKKFMLCPWFITDLPQRSEQEWLEKQRRERLDEFAPPSFYYADQTPSGKTKENRSSKLSNNRNQLNEHCISGSGDVVKDIVGKQLSDIRSELDNNTGLISEVDKQKEEIQSTHSSGLNVRQGNQMEQVGFSTEQPVAPCQSFNFAPPPVYNTNSFPPINLQVPPPPLPAGIMPPLPITQLVPGPAQINAPASSTFDFTVPPPSWNVIHQGGASIGNTNNSTCTAPSEGTHGLNHVPANETKTKFVPRMSVLDTRFMESE